MIGFAISKNSIKIRLEEERWFHIVENHDYMSGLSSDVLDTIEKPDVIIKGKKGELIAAKEFKGRHLMVIYKETSKQDGFVITAFMTSEVERIKRKGVIWKKQS